MSVYVTTRHGRFYRNADKAMLGGVCAGLADYFGFRLGVTRFLAIIAFLAAMPVAVIGYLATVLLVPARSAKGDKANARRRRRAERSDPPPTAKDVRERCRSLDRRLARLEKYVTSSRYELDREFSRL